MFEGPVQDLIDELGKLPGIGPKSAQRIAFHLLSVEPPDIDRLTAVLNKVRDGVKFCANDGTPLGATALGPKGRCPKCGTEMLGAKFCPRDGTAMVPQE